MRHSSQPPMCVSIGGTTPSGYCHGSGAYPGLLPSSLLAAQAGLRAHPIPVCQGITPLGAHLTRSPLQHLSQSALHAPDPGYVKKASWNPPWTLALTKMSWNCLSLVNVVFKSLRVSVLWKSMRPGKSGIGPKAEVAQNQPRSAPQASSVRVQHRSWQNRADALYPGANNPLLRCTLGAGLQGLKRSKATPSREHLFLVRPKLGGSGPYFAVPSNPVKCAEWPHQACGTSATATSDAESRNGAEP